MLTLLVITNVRYGLYSNSHTFMSYKIVETHICAEYKFSVYLFIYLLIYTKRLEVKEQ